ncbi:uncharacterized protein [Cherax quadricarinatus]|uniref:uncharacterized protein n=1 Tax=Cherax quadricarinatus TaxID=27406 RepID=UPI002378A976|nr:uncharacterized protein LOC128699249 [Cherax quadricarinatus]
MRSMCLLVLLYVYLMKVESTEAKWHDDSQVRQVNDEPVATNGNSTVENGNSTAQDNITLNERYGQGCRALESCEHKRGVCRTHCEGPHEEAIAHGCSGNGCWCCIKKHKNCRRRDECRDARGKCQSKECGPNHRVIHRGCNGKSCWCCAPRHHDNDHVGHGNHGHGGQGGHEKPWGHNRETEKEPASETNVEIPADVIVRGHNEEQQENPQEEHVVEKEEAEEEEGEEEEEGNEEEQQEGEEQ